MTRATWNGATIAESDATIVVEGNHYFPADSVNSDLLQPTDHTSVCPWKGNASYFSIVVDGQENTNAAWTYVTPKEKAANIAGYVAFWKGVTVES